MWLLDLQGRRREAMLLRVSAARVERLGGRGMRIKRSFRQVWHMLDGVGDGWFREVDRSERV